MTNLVEIKYASTEKYPSILINGEAISRYMSLSDYIYDDIFRWADQFFEIMDGELAESYKVVVTGHPYHLAVLENFKDKSEYCEGIEYKKAESRISLKEKYAFACKLNNQYSIIPPLGDKVIFSCSEPDSLNALNMSGVAFTGEGKDYGIYRFGYGDALQTKYTVCICENEKIEKRRDGTTLYVSENNLATVMDYFYTYHIVIPTVQGVFAKLPTANVAYAEKLEFEAYTEESYRLIIDPLPDTMEAGHEFQITYDYFPKCFPKPAISVVIDNPAVMAYNGGYLVAKDKGVCNLHICDTEGKEYASKSIDVSKHNYATNITVVLPETTMQIGETLKFRCIVTPNDAEDANDLCYSINNENVAVFSNKNELYAVAAGRICVTVSAKKVSRKFYVTVLSEATGIAVSAEEAEIPCTAEATVYCAPIPLDASPAPAMSWFVSNPSVLRIVSQDSTRCVVRTLCPGNAELICKIDGSNIEKHIRITVPKVKGCYVATAVYGSYDCPEVWVLRRFRDNYLDQHLLGKLFIKVYYALSPAVVRIFGKQKWFNKFWRARLDKMVSTLQEKGYEETPYNGG